MFEKHATNLFWKLLIVNCLAIISMLALALLIENRGWTIPDESQREAPHLEQ